MTNQLFGHSLSPLLLLSQSRKDECHTNVTSLTAHIENAKRILVPPSKLRLLVRYLTSLDWNDCSKNTNLKLLRYGMGRSRRRWWMTPSLSAKERHSFEWPEFYPFKSCDREQGQAIKDLTTSAFPFSHCRYWYDREYFCLSAVCCRWQLRRG